MSPTLIFRIIRHVANSHHAFIVVHAAFTVVHAAFTVVHAAIAVVHAAFTVMHVAFTVVHAAFTVVHCVFNVVLLLSCPSHNFIPLVGTCLCQLSHCGQVVSRAGLVK